MSSITKRLGGTLRGQVLYVLGLIGGIMSVFSALQDTLKLAAWAQAVVENFQWVTTQAWQFALPFLEFPLRPMDVLFLNVALFMTALVIASLSRHTTPARRLADVNWASTIAGGVGFCIALAVIFYAGFSAIQATLENETSRQLLKTASLAPEGPARESAALAYVSYMSAFFHTADWIAQTIGLAHGSLIERLDKSALVLLGLVLALTLLPSFLALAAGRLFGFHVDNQKLAIRVWRFNFALALLFILNYLSLIWSNACSEQGDTFSTLLCTTF